MADAMEMMILSILAPQLHCEWRLPSWQVALLTSVSDGGLVQWSSASTLLGCFGGVPLLLMHPRVSQEMKSRTASAASFPSPMLIAAPLGRYQLSYCQGTGTHLSPPLTPCKITFFWVGVKIQQGGHLHTANPCSIPVNTHVVPRTLPEITSYPLYYCLCS